MSSKPTQNPEGINSVTGTSFAKMSALEKITHVGKVIVFFLSFGFAFPNVFSD